MAQSEIPNDIRSAAEDVVDRGYNVGLVDAVAQALLAERERCAAEKKALQRMVSDGLYMLLAYRDMLGEKGSEVAAMWAAKGIKRVHFDWTDEAVQMTGEQRAEEILAWERAKEVLT